MSATFSDISDNKYLKNVKIQIRFYNFIKLRACFLFCHVCKS